MLFGWKLFIDTRFTKELRRVPVLAHLVHFEATLRGTYLTTIVRELVPTKVSVLDNPGTINPRFAPQLAVTPATL